MATGDNHKVNRIRLIGKLNTFLKRWWQGVILSEKNSYIYGGNREDKMQLFDDLVKVVLSKLEEKMMGPTLRKIDMINFQYLRSNMMALSAKAFDVGEKLKKAKFFTKKKKKEVENWLGQVQKIENNLRTLENEMQTEGFVIGFLHGGQAVELGTTIHELVEQIQQVDELVHDLGGIKGETLLTRELVGEEFEKNLETILRSLLVDKVSRVGIYGMGGVGKTTLAKHVNNRLQEQTQERVAWITVSQKFTITRLQDEIAKFVHLDLRNEHDEYKRAMRLRRVLSKTKNLVFVFDDVWETMRLKMLGFIYPLLVDKCKLLITTRSRRVCYQLDCEEIIEVKKLKENEAWNLFKVTFGGELNLVPEVQNIAKSMVEICDGLPLGIITIAESMKGETDCHLWRNALANLKESILGQEDMEEYVFKVLKYSFDWLDKQQIKNNGYSKAQLCFLYCSLYPEDFNINKEELIRKFILEEALDKRKSRKGQFLQGHSILGQLVNVCLLERVNDDFVKMDKITRAMALKIIQGKTKVISGSTFIEEIPNEEEWTEGLEKMSSMNNGIKTIPYEMSPNCPKLSTLILAHNPLKFIPKSFFLKMHSLFILDLSWTKIKKLPDSLSDIESLKALLLTNCFNLEYMPFLGKLKKLVELDLTRTLIHEMPQGMEELLNLKFLSWEECNKLALVPEGLLLKFSYLQCIYLPHHIQVPREEIQGLKHLEEFRGRVQDAGDYNCLIESRPSLAYYIRVGLGNMDDGGYRGYNQLVFSEYDFNAREDKDVTILAKDIHHLNLQWCKGLSNCLVDDFRMLDYPTSITILYIVDCEDIECLMKIEHCLDTCTITSISSPCPTPHDFFSSLNILWISGCHEIKRLGLLTSQLQNLKQLKIGCCEMIEEIMEVSKDIGQGESRKASIVSLPKLEHLHLVGLPSLNSICNARIVCYSIQKVTLRRCQALEELPLVFGEPDYDCPPLALTEICLRKDEKEWWDKLKLGHDSHHSLLQPFIKWSNH